MIPILDAGHGGFIGGKYQCLAGGKKSPEWSKGVLFEGVSNRDFIHQIKMDLINAEVPFFDTGISDADRPLKSRVYRANQIFSQHPNTYLFSVHSNAAGGTGIEGFTSRGETKSDKIAEYYLKAFEKRFPKEKMRFDYFDGDRDKEADYYILKWTRCPAFLIELWFFDNPTDYLKLKDPQFRREVSSFISSLMIQLYKTGL